MFNILLILGVALIVAVVAAAVVITSRPDSFHVGRSAEIHAPIDVVFSLINNLHQWSRWSPFEKLDPNMKITFDGPPEGPGASRSWSGNAKAGSGRMTILEIRPDELVSMKLEFFKPFEATNQATFKLAPTAAGTQVSWSMDGKHNLIAKAMFLIVDCDKMIGKEFEEGLANLDAVAQAEIQTRTQSTREAHAEIK